MIMKYIVFEDGSAIVFAENQDHIKMANNKPVRSAGFCWVETTRNQYDDLVFKDCVCYGRSDSLNVDSRPDDKDVIREVFTL